MGSSTRTWEGLDDGIYNIQDIAEGSVEGCDDEEGFEERREDGIGPIPSSRRSPKPSSASKLHKMVASIMALEKASMRAVDL